MEFRAANIAVLLLTTIVSVGFAQQAGLPISPAEEQAAALPSFPYVAQITGNNVYVRSGPGTENYDCGKVNRGDTVVVVDRKPLWSCIVPPAGSFSWISTQYIKFDRTNPTIGVVTGDNIRIWAGAEQVQPMHSTRKQVELNKGEKVMLLGEERDGYYKIAPPDGAYLWVSTRFTQPLAPAAEVPLTVLPEATDLPPTRHSNANPQAPVVAPTNLPLEARKLKEYYDIEKQIKAQHDKPIAEQDYTHIRLALEGLSADKTIHKAARYAQFALKQIGRYEMAVKADKAIRLQDNRLQGVQQRIAKAQATKLDEIDQVDIGKYAVVGKFEKSNIYGPEKVVKHYRVVDDDGKIICYARPGTLAPNTNFDRFVGQKVGLVGMIIAHEQTNGALVKFSEVVELMQ